ncbi:MAG TPA: glycosyltransferase [Nitrososphaeraceae archaeon]|nr:glycosyltransferase [Nitrososphaeraceae archaeon]
MRIAHINNTAGIASILSRHQRLLGNEADVFVFNKYLHKQFGGEKVNYYLPLSRWRFFKKLKGYDIWHYHYPYGSLKRTLEKRKEKRICLKHYHGDDLRGKYDNDFCLVSTPDLLEFAPNGEWFPTPLDLEHLVCIPRNFDDSSPSRRPIVAHYPHYRLYQKYGDLYSNTLQQLQKEGKCEIVTIFDIPHNEVLTTLSSCDLVIGKILPQIGWFGKFELEAMALGKPVVAFVNSELFQRYDPPIYNTTKDSFKKDLESILSDIEEQRKLSKAGRLYVEKYHSVSNLLKQLDRAYSQSQQ